ncbi:MAG: hypothetical protein WBP13_12130 [Methylophilaceae bacterium]
MKNKQLICSLILIGGVAFSGVALADRGFGHGGHRGHGGFGLSIGLPFYGSAYYGSPYYGSPYYAYPYAYPYAYYPPQAIVAPAQPQVYIQQDNTSPAAQQPSAPQANNYWYYCLKPKGYYPYVKECPAGWQKVAPTPPGEN